MLCFFQKHCKEVFPMLESVMNRRSIRKYTP